MSQPPHPSPFPGARPVGKILPRPPPPPPAYQIWPCLKRPGFLFTKKDQNWVIGCRHRCLCASLMCKQHCRALTQRRRPRHTQAPPGLPPALLEVPEQGVKSLGAGRGWLSTPKNAGGQRPGAAGHLKHRQVVCGAPPAGPEVTNGTLCAQISVKGTEKPQKRFPWGWGRGLRWMGAARLFPAAPQGWQEERDSLSWGCRDLYPIYGVF